MKTGRIVACFPCSGKTHFVLNNWRTCNCIDFDFYDWMYMGQLGDKWLTEYLDRMKQLSRYFDFVYINATPEILERIYINSIIIYPKRELKEEWLRRAIKRGGETDFPKLLEEKWNYWITVCQAWEGKKYQLDSGEYVSDIYKRICSLTTN